MIKTDLCALFFSLLVPLLIYIWPGLSKRVKGQKLIFLRTFASAWVLIYVFDMGYALLAFASGSEQLTRASFVFALGVITWSSLFLGLLDQGPPRKKYRRRKKRRLPPLFSGTAVPIGVSR